MNRSKTLCAKCFVPWCKNTTTKNREKAFIILKEAMKKKWCKEVGITNYQPGRRYWCCEDHLDLNDVLIFDMKNGKQFFKLKSTAKLYLKKPNDNLPSNKDVTAVADEVQNLFDSSVLQTIENLSTNARPTKLATNKENTRPTAVSASTHPVNVAVQCCVKMMDKSTATPKSLLKPRPSSPTSSTSFASDASSAVAASSVDVLYEESTSSSSIEVQSSRSSRKQILQFISNDPKAYIGLPKQYFWLINYIVSQSNKKVKELDIIITLLKIKLNDTVQRICDQFEIAQTTFSKSFFTGIEVLATFFQNLIFMPTLLQIKLNQPLTFKIRYSNVVMLLDAFEIEIQRPHNPERQAQTWSQYKHCNTIKYLVGSTPNGFITFISEGYGGRISDKSLAEKSGLIDFLPHNAVIMADRGFKEIESILSAKGIKLIRPPSVYASHKPTKEEVIQTKVIASLRVHIERVIRRIREYRFLKPHSVVSHKHVAYLDHIVLIACGLINLQDEIIRSE